MGCELLQEADEQMSIKWNGRTFGKGPLVQGADDDHERERVSSVWSVLHWIRSCVCGVCTLRCCLLLVLVLVCVMLSGARVRVRARACRAVPSWSLVRQNIVMRRVPCVSHFAVCDDRVCALSACVPVCLSRAGRGTRRVRSPRCVTR